MLNKIICRLIRDIRILFQKDRILADLAGDFVFRIFRIYDTKRKVRIKSTFWWGFRITITMRWVSMGWVVRGWVYWMNGVVRWAGREY